MADTKISAMTPAAEVKNADVYPIVSGGANFNATKAQMLIGAAGEQIVIQGAGGQNITIVSALGVGNIVVDDAAGVLISSSISASLQSGAGANFTFCGCTFGVSAGMSCGNGVKVKIEIVGAGFIQLNGPTNALTIGGFGAASYQYFMGNPFNWMVPALTLENAIDRLAVQVAALIGGPIP